jgi:hypothetical protein
MDWVGVLITRRCTLLRNLPYQHLTPLPPRYFTSSLVNKIFAYDYDLESGAVSNRRNFIEGKALNLPANSFCDGLCIDSEGCIWSARFVTLVTSDL